MKNSARTGNLISNILLVGAIILLLVVNSVPDVEMHKMSDYERLQHSLGIDKTETPMWKNICYVIMCVLVILSMIVRYIMCKCKSCGSHIYKMNLFTSFCPYCGKELISN